VLQVLRAQGVRVLTVREILAFGVEERMGARVELEELAASTLTYRLAEGEPQPRGGGRECSGIACTQWRQHGCSKVSGVVKLSAMVQSACMARLSPSLHPHSHTGWQRVRQGGGDAVAWRDAMASTAGCPYWSSN
jgi:hypothetical protein